MSRTFLFKTTFVNERIVEHYTQRRNNVVTVSKNNDKKLLRFKNHHRFVIRNDEHHRQINVLENDLRSKEID